MTDDLFLQKIQLHVPKHPQLLNQLAKTATTNADYFNNLIDELQHSEAARLRVRQYIARVFLGKDLTYTLVELGITSRVGFTAELIRKIKHTILPEEKNNASFNQTLLRIFSNTKPKREQLTLFFDAINLNITFSNEALQTQLLDAIEILSYRITASAIESELIQRFKTNQLLQSFITQNKEVQSLIAQHQLGVNFNPHLAQHIKQLLSQSVSHVKILKTNSQYQGISLQLAYSLHRLTQQIERLNLLLDFYITPAKNNQELAHYICQILEAEQSKNNIKRQLNNTTYLLAYQITEHESKTGEHYIADNKKQYKSMFNSSCGGGVFAVCMTVIKIILHHLHFAPFWQAFSYSLNYAAGFVGIQVTHATLATKQPAMTASKIAKEIDQNGNDEQAVKSIALLIGKVARSQFVSFAGNLVIVFPLAFCVAWLWQILSGKNIVSHQEALTMLSDVHPFYNPTWFYASITGVFLFLSGIISGYYDNKSIYGKISLRIRHHPYLKTVLRKRTLIQFSSYVEQNLGSLIGNICLGFFLGTAGFIGFIFGIPFDIRHITISSGNYAIALCVVGTSLPVKYLLTCLIGVLGVGAFNFLLSFGLAVIVAARSRKVSHSKFIPVLKCTFLYLKKYPSDFFIAPKQNRSTEDLN